MTTKTSSAVITPDKINAALEAAYIPYAMSPKIDADGRARCVAVPGVYRPEAYPIVCFRPGDFTVDEIVEHCRDAAASV